MKNIYKVKELARLIRVTIEKMDIEEFPNSSYFKDFPRGCCGDASNLLAKYLKENGFKTEYVCGMRGKQSHAWLEYMDLIIDITADQFPEIKDKVIVTKDRTWYSQFDSQSRHEGDFDGLESYNKRRLTSIYNNIIKRAFLK